MKIQSYFLLILSVFSMQLSAMEAGFVSTQNNNNNNAIPSTITIQCSDGQKLEYPNTNQTIEILKLSETIKNYLEAGTATSIYVQIPSNEFKQVFELMKNLYVCNQSHDSAFVYGLTKQELKELNEIIRYNYHMKLSELNIEQLNKLYNYFDYLNIPLLMDTCLSNLTNKFIKKLIGRDSLSNNDYNNGLAQLSEPLQYSFARNIVNQIKETVIEKCFLAKKDKYRNEGYSRKYIIDCARSGHKAKNENWVNCGWYSFNLDPGNQITNYFKNDVTLEQALLLHAILKKKDIIKFDTETLYAIFDSFPAFIQKMLNAQDNVEFPHRPKDMGPIARGISNFLKDKLLNR